MCGWLVRQKVSTSLKSAWSVFFSVEFALWSELIQSITGLSIRCISKKMSKSRPLNQSMIALKTFIISRRLIDFILSVIHSLLAKSYSAYEERCIDLVHDLGTDCLCSFYNAQYIINVCYNVLQYVTMCVTACVRATMLNISSRHKYRPTTTARRGRSTEYDISASKFSINRFKLA